MKKLFIVASALCLSLMAGSGYGAVRFEFVETGGDVVGTLSGSVNTTGLIIPSRNVTPIPFIEPLESRVGTGTGNSNVSTYTGLSGPSSFGSGVLANGNSTGDAFLIVGSIPSFGVLGLNENYTSNDPLSGTLTFANTTILGLGITPGTYIYSVPSTDTVTLTFTPAVIPLPATLPLLLGALGLAVAATRRRRA